MSLKDALAGGGAFLTGAALLIGALGGEQIQPVDNARDHLNPFASSPAEWRCPSGMTETHGTDPDAGAAFTACESDRYIIKKLEGGDPVRLDKETGKIETLP